MTGPLGEIRADPRCPPGCVVAWPADRPEDGAAFIPGLGVVALRDLLRAPYGLAAGYQGA